MHYFLIDAFTRRAFGGNPAAIVPLPAGDWPEDAALQALAAEFNLSETAYFRPHDGGFGLRWFTPAVEVDLCGHATLAAAHVLFSELDRIAPAIRFETRSGALTVERGEAGALAMDFPAQAAEPADTRCAELGAMLGAAPADVRVGPNVMAVFDRADQVAELTPDFAALATLEQRRGCIATAPGDGGTDFVSRYFVPSAGIDEDPVTGSAHCMLTPYWAERLGKQTLTARQISARGGDLTCTLAGDRVLLAGHAVTVAAGQLRTEAAAALSTP